MTTTPPIRAQIRPEDAQERFGERWRPCHKDDVPADAAFVDHSIQGVHWERVGRTPDGYYMKVEDWRIPPGTSGYDPMYAVLRERVPRTPIEAEADDVIARSIRAGGILSVPWSAELDGELRARWRDCHLLQTAIPAADPDKGPVFLGSNWGIQLVQRRG